MARLALMELLALVRLIACLRSRSRQYAPAGITGTEQEHRELARTIRGLSERYRGRVAAHTLRQFSDAASAGRWESAIDQLIMALHARAEAVTSREREELRTILTAMNMPGNCVDNLPAADKSATGE